LKAKLVVKTGGIELSDDFYGVISEVWRNLGTPTHKKQFFEIILKTFRDRSKLIVLYLGGRPISAALIVIENNILYHPYAGTLRKFNPLSVNNVLYWKIIEHGCEHGCDAFDMGRSLHNSGTYRYKRSWGATPVPLFYTYFMTRGRKKPENNTLLARSMVNTWKFLPVTLANALGPGLIKGVL
jgi:lipid II:glycine glycyltransferase (peptidoglycan interpeptide bridge formation enzyme)